MTDAVNTPLAGLEAVVAGVPGVDQVYRSSALAEAVTVVAGRITRARAAQPARIRVEDGVVSVTIGVADGAAAPAVVHAVHDAVEAALRQQGLPFVRADITVARIG